MGDDAFLSFVVFEQCVFLLFGFTTHTCGERPRFCQFPLEESVALVELPALLGWPAGKNAPQSCLMAAPSLSPSLKLAREPGRACSGRLGGYFPVPSTAWMVSLGSTTFFASLPVPSETSQSLIKNCHRGSISVRSGS
eukprot:SAG22_NODE_16_length_32723_cov_26.404825_36_plen_138_part_00